MTDIVNQLRDRKITVYGKEFINSWSQELHETADPLCIAAAEEIERLRAANKDLQAWFDDLMFEFNKLRGVPNTGEQK